MSYDELLTTAGMKSLHSKRVSAAPAKSGPLDFPSANHQLV